MCCSRARSGGGILHLSRPQYLFAEETAQVFRCAKIDRPTDNRFEFKLHACQPNETRFAVRLELNQNIKIAFWPKPFRQHRSEQSEPADLIPSAKLSDEFTIELDVGGHRERLYRPWQTLGAV
jgi:regulation of enolase protein 1 (concanavalin A-like superfamily)